MLLEHDGTECERNLHGLDVVGPLMRRVTDRNLRIALPEQLNLAEVKVIIGRGYSPTQCMMVSDLFRWPKKTDYPSISSRGSPAVEATMGRSYFAILSRSGQSVM